MIIAYKTPILLQNYNFSHLFLKIKKAFLPFEFLALDEKLNMKNPK